MPGISNVLSIAKEALLAHQLSMQVASNNIANVDTPGYTRQTLELQAATATPISAGMLGGGVQATTILRNYDQFMVQRLVQQQSNQGSLQSQQDSMNLVETVFNEAPGMAVNDLTNQFWTAWQSLTNNPDILSTRQSVVQSAQSVIDQLHSMTAEITTVKSNISTSLDTAIGDVNSITKQIADLNVQISTTESSNGQANDLRDKRDSLLQNLGSQLNISYFENKNGSYSVLMADGHPLVEGNESWQVGWKNNQLLWINQDVNGNTVSKAVGNGVDLGGKIGGWLKVNGDLEEGNPTNILGRLNAFANSLIREVNQQHSQGVGTTLFSTPLTGSEQAKNVARLTTPVDSTTATTTIPAGTITINNRSVGEIDGATASNGLAMAKASNAVDAINNAETGVTAKLTTLVTGSTVDATNLTAGATPDTIGFAVNGVAVSYTVVANDVGNNAVFAGHLKTAINSAISTYNAAATTTNPVNLQAVVGDTTNGGVANSIVLQNTNAGDDSAITVDNLSGTFTNVLATTSTLGFDAVSGKAITADATHNTGEITLFSTTDYTLNAGSNDYTLAQLGMGGGNQTTTVYDGGLVDSTVTNPATTITFNLNGKAVTVTAPINQSAAQLVTAVQTGINGALPAPPPAITVSLVNGKIHFANTTSGNHSPIVVDSFALNTVATPLGDPTIFGFGNFTARAGGVSSDLQPNDGTITYGLTNDNQGPLLAGYDYFNQLKPDTGSFDIWIYNTDGTLAMPKPVTVSLKGAYSLNDMVNIINKTVANATNGSGWVTASNQQDSLRLTPDATHKFAFANDTSNFLQVAGLNTFFTGSSAADIGINSGVANDPNTLAAGTINAQGQIFTGDNSNALKITDIQNKQNITYTGGAQNTLDNFYNSLVGEVANNTSTISNSYNQNTLLTNQLNTMRDSTSGVSLDEEMANLIKYQHAYTAAARLITMSDEMLKTLLGAVGVA